jgi:hypothetical protein
MEAEWLRDTQWVSSIWEEKHEWFIETLHETSEKEFMETQDGQNVQMFEGWVKLYRSYNRSLIII